MRKIIVFIQGATAPSSPHVLELTEPPQRTDNIIEALTPIYTLQASTTLQELQESFIRLAENLQDIRQNLSLEDALKAIAANDSRVQLQIRATELRRPSSAKAWTERLEKGHLHKIYWHRIRSNPG